MEKSLNALLEDSEYQELRRAASLHYIHWLILLGSLALTFLAWYVAKSQAEERMHSLFERESAQVVALVQERMELYENVLWGGVASIKSHTYGMEHDEWRDYSHALRIDTKYPGINGIGVIFDVKPENLETFLAEQRKTRPDFKIHPKHENNDFYPITYIEPEENNAAALGLDMAHEKNRYAAIKKAIDTGEATITGPIVLVQDTGRMPGFLFYAPYYKQDGLKNFFEKRQNFIGVVYAPFIFKNLIQGTLADDVRHVDIEISDDGALLYSEFDPENDEYQATPLLKKLVEIPMYGRQWQFNIRTDKSFDVAVQDNKPIMILVTGLIIDALLLFLFLAFARANKRAVKIADKTADMYLKKSSSLEENLAFQQIVMDENPDFLFVKNKYYEIVSANRAFLEAYPEDMRDSIIGTTTVEEYDQKDAEIFLAQDKIAFEKGYSEVEETLTMPNGQKKILATRKIRFENKAGDPFILCVARDITAYKNLSNELRASNEELEEFAYRTSHDLRSPLVSSLALLKMMRGFIEGGDKEKSLQALDHSISSLSKLENLVKDILSLTAVQKAEKDKKIIQIKDVVDEAMGKIAHMDGFDRITWHIELDYKRPYVCLESRFRLIVENLMSNAVKYQDYDKDAQVWIRSYDDNGAFSFEIEDNGLGIPEEHQDKVFSMFKRMHPKTAFGSGLGLYMVKKSAKILGGDMVCINRNGHTVFKYIEK